MEIVGFIEPDAPDPAVELRRRIAGLGFPIAGLVDQPHLTALGEPGLQTSSSRSPNGEHERSDAAVTRSYLLRRNPEDDDDPVNLAALDDLTRAALDAPPPAPLPRWLMDARARMRFPHLWECVRTSWRAPARHEDLASVLVAHAEYVLTNRFRTELGLGPQDRCPRISARALQPHPVLVDGTPVPGLLLDTDPFVLAVAARLAPDRVVTVVVAREHLPFVTLELVADAPLG